MTGVIRSMSNISYLSAAGLILLAVTVNQGAVNTYVKQQSLELEANRIQNGVKALGSIPKGKVEIDIEGYTFNYEGEEFTIAYKDEEVSRDLSEGYLGENTYRWGKGEKEVKKLCLEKDTEESGGEKQEIIYFKDGGC